MLKRKILALVVAVVLMLPLTSVSAKEPNAGTVVGYTSSTKAEIPSGGNQSGTTNTPNTGDSTSLGNLLITLGLSSTLILILILKNWKEEDYLETI